MRAFGFPFLLAVILTFAAAGLMLATPQSSNLSAISPAPNESAFLMLSDIHFDPFTGTDRSIVQELASAPVEDWERILKPQADQPVAPDGADTNYSLLLSALDAARNSGVHYDYVLFTGDFLGHNFPAKYRLYGHPTGDGYESFVVKTISFVTRVIQQVFPSVPVYAVFGNNDSLGGDYAPQDPRLLAAMQKEWKVVGSQAKKDFLAGGYYAARHPAVANFEFIVLNTSYWSNRLDASTASSEGSVQLKWLATQLDELRRRHGSAAILMHVPPGIDAYASATPGRCASPAFFWQKAAMDSFMAIISAHRDTLRDAYAGHTHLDDFRVFADSSGMAFFQTHIAPSISRDHHNRPGFEIGLYEKQTGAMVDYAAEYMVDPGNGAATKPNWKLAYDFRQDAHLDSYSPENLESLALLIRSSDIVRKRLFQRYGTPTSAVQALARDWRYYSCAQTEFEAAPYHSCACPD